MIKINGKESDAAGLTIDAYLEKADFDAARIVVEYNMEILKKENYANTVIKDGDVIEIISFMGGG